MLKNIYIDNYRCFVNFEATFGPRHLLIGGNGSGKSSLFDVLALIRDFCVRDELVDRESGLPRIAGSTRTRWQNVAEQTFRMTVAGNGGEYRLRLVVDSWGKLGEPERPRVVAEEVTFDGNPIFSFELGEVRLFNDHFEGKVKYPFDWHRSALATITERHENTKLTWFKRWLDGLLIVAPDPRRMAGIAALEARRPTQDLANFADWYRQIKLAGDDRAYLDDLAEIFEGFDLLRFDPIGERRHELKARFKLAGARGSHSPPEYFLNELSDGQRVLIGLYAILHFAMKPHTTVCFDGPDNFIALREVEPWLVKVLDRTEDESGDSQIFIASHHPELLNKMAFENGLRLDRPDGRHTQIHPFRDPSSTGLLPAELVARGWDS